VKVPRELLVSFGIARCLMELPGAESRLRPPSNYTYARRSDEAVRAGLRVLAVVARSTDLSACVSQPFNPLLSCISLHRTGWLRWQLHVADWC